MGTYIPEEKEKIIESLTSVQENMLKAIHAKTYIGNDDDMSDAFEAWLEAQPVELLKEYLNYTVYNV